MVEKVIVPAREVTAVSSRAPAVTLVNEMSKSGPTARMGPTPGKMTSWS